MPPHEHDSAAAPASQASGGARASGPEGEAPRSSSHADEPTRVSDGRSGAEAGAGAAFEQPTIEGYALHEELHRGGQGVVYRATQLGTKQQVALKVLLEGPFASPSTRARFEREVELAASLRHPSIVSILDSGISRGRYYFAMPFIEGRRLDRYLREARPGLEATLQLLERIAETVNFAHQRGVIHRDLKPSNILIGPDGAPHILDFGLAKSAREPDPQQTTVRMLSTSGQVIGTLAYMSPEQARGAQDVDVRSDVYGLGVILYEALLGRPPYDVTGPLGDVLTRIAQAEPVRPRAARSDSRFGRMIDDELETILLKALEKDPERRYQTAGDLARDLRHYLRSEPIEAKRASNLYLIRKLLRRYRMQAIAAGLVLATLVVCLGVVAYWYSQERELRRRFQLLEERAKLTALKAQRAAASAATAESREREARRRAERNEQATLEANERLRGALIEQMISRGDMAMLRGDLIDARESYWEAYGSGPDKPAARWVLRRYYGESGDVGAVQLGYGAPALIAMSASGAYAAVVDPAGISVRRSDTGQEQRWLATPDEATAVSLSEGGALAAAGRRWVAWWSPERDAPQRLLAWDGPPPVSVHLDSRTSRLLVAAEGEVRAFDGATGRPTGKAALRGGLSGRPALAPGGKLLAAPTREGLEAVRVEKDGRLRSETLWRPSGAEAATAVTAVTFVSDELVYLLADGVYRGQLGQRPPQWERLVQLRERFDMLDVDPLSQAFVLASRDGQVATIRKLRLERYWRTTLAGLRDVRWQQDGQAVLTLDGRGALTRWVAPQEAQSQRLLAPVALARWEVAEDGGAIAWVTAQGEVAIYAPDVAEHPQVVSLPGLLEAITGRDPEDIDLALSAGGQQVLVRYGQRVWRVRKGDAGYRRPAPLFGRSPPGMKIRAAALSGDGRVAAFHTISDTQERQFVAFRTPQARGAGGGAGTWRTVDFTGSAIVQIGFVPGTHTLLVARSNGALLQVEPVGDGGAAAGDPGAAWLTLESPAYRFALSRDGARVALACGDGRIRVITTDEAREVAQVPAPRRVTAMDFGPAGRVLMVRLADGAQELYELDNAQRIARWDLARGPGRPLAAWIGDGDDFVRTTPEGVVRVDFDLADASVARDERFGLQREVARRIDDGAFDAAWEAAGRLRQRADALGARAQRDLLGLTLRSRLRTVPAEWIETGAGGAAPRELWRLAHAAYAGGRFRLAQRWFAQAAGPGGGAPDAYTAWRMAECAYLLEPPADAARELSKVLSGAALLADDLPRVRLETLAALLRAGRLAQARALFERMQTREGAAERETVGMLATLLIGKQMFGEASTKIEAAFAALLNVFKEQWLDYRDDLEFFAGEMALARGDRRTAEAQYQLCIEIARDAWPVDWARLRLEQLASAGAPGGGARDAQNARTE